MMVVHPYHVQDDEHATYLSEPVWQSLKSRWYLRALELDIQVELELVGNAVGKPSISLGYVDIWTWMRLLGSGCRGTASDYVQTLITGRRNMCFPTRVAIEVPYQQATAGTATRLEGDPNTQSRAR